MEPNSSYAAYSYITRDVGYIVYMMSIFDGYSGLYDGRRGRGRGGACP